MAARENPLVDSIELLSEIGAGCSEIGAIGAASNEYELAESSTIRNH
jgi:hypothetical protein